MLLAIATAHRACSLALIDGGEAVRSVHESIGRGHAEGLLPMLSDLLGTTRPTAIVVEAGPGSFTGIRIGIAAARALALAWSVPVHGVASTLLLAAEAKALGGPWRLTVLLDGGRGEVFRQEFDGLAERGAAVAEPASAVRIGGNAAIGTGVPLVALPDRVRNLGAAVPRAAAVRWVPAEGRAMPPAPIYVRAPDAKVSGSG